MKVYFDGCSWTNGAELDHPEQERFSKLICDEFGAEETNLSIKGGSNDRIVRNLLVEHNMHFVNNLVDHSVVINFGEKIYEGPPRGAQNDKGVREAYLGQE